VVASHADFENGLSQWERENPDQFLKEGYDEEAWKITRYLRTLRKPEEMSIKQFRKFKKHALKFLVHDGHFFRRATKNVPFRRITSSTQA
jgi:hypothetical protein